MNQLLVNAPHGYQQLLDIEEGGGYFDASRVLWDTRIDGPLPEITLGGMVRNGLELVFDQSRMDASIAAIESPEEIRAKAKAAREAAVAAIKVTTAAGNTFDGDEVSQGRMARAILALSTGLAPSVNWVLADNSVIEATAAELNEALVLAGQAQAAIWVIS